MTYNALADFIDVLEREGELVRIRAEVSADLEAAVISERVLDISGSALLFERIKEQKLPVATNLLGSERRLCLALGIPSVSDFSARWSQLTETENRPGWWERLKTRSSETPTAITRFEPKGVKTGVCQQIVKLGRDVDLTQFPALRSWEHETVRSITAGQLFAANAGSKHVSLVNSPLLVLDRARLGIPWHPHSTLPQLVELAKERGEKLPVAVVLGGSPTLNIFSRLPFDAETNLLALAGLWNGAAINIVRCRTQPLDVPAEAELVIEGYLDPNAAGFSLPTFVSPSGTYAENFPGQAIEVTAVTHRSSAIWPSTVYELPASELTPLGRLAERLLLPELKELASEIFDIALPNYGTNNAFVFVSVKQPYPGAARRVTNAIWSHAALMLVKTIVLVDAREAIHDSAVVWERVAAKVDPVRDIFFQAGPTDPFDFSNQPGLAEGKFSSGSKLGIDATTRDPASHPSTMGRRPMLDIETVMHLGPRWKELGLEPASSKPGKKSKA